MIFAESIDHREYYKGLYLFQLSHPAKAWSVDGDAPGQAYYLPGHGAYCILHDTPDAVYIGGAFRALPYPGASQAIVDLCYTRHGNKPLKLDAYSMATPAWQAVGFKTTHVVPWKLALAPDLWLPAYGEQNVCFMQRRLEWLN